MRGECICQFGYIGSRRRFTLVLAKVGCRQLMVDRFEVFGKFRVPNEFGFSVVLSHSLIAAEVLRRFHKYLMVMIKQAK